MPPITFSERAGRSGRPEPSERPERFRNPLTDATIRVCPECAGPIAKTSGCVTCLQCGWGKCG